MIRRAVLALGAALTLTACTTFSDADAVARVNDTELSSDMFDDLTVLLGPQAASTVGTGLNADDARNLIAQWLQVAIIQDHLAEIGVDVTTETLDQAEAVVAGDPGLAEVDGDARAFVVSAQASIETFNGLPDPQASFEGALDAADIYVDPRYGFFDPSAGVLPVGLGLNPGLAPGG